MIVLLSKSCGDQVQTCPDLCLASGSEPGLPDDTEPDHKYCSRVLWDTWEFQMCCKATEP